MAGRFNPERQPSIKNSSSFSSERKGQPLQQKEEHGRSSGAYRGNRRRQDSRETGRGCRRHELRLGGGDELKDTWDIPRVRIGGKKKMSQPAALGNLGSAEWAPPRTAHPPLPGNDWEVAPRHGVTVPRDRRQLVSSLSKGGWGCTSAGEAQPVERQAGGICPGLAAAPPLNGPGGDPTEKGRSQWNPTATPPAYMGIVKRWRYYAFKGYKT